MTMPFSRPGAVDLSALRRPAPSTAAPAGASGPAPGAGGSPATAARSSYVVEVGEQNFEAVLQTSMTAPLVLVVYSPSRMPASAQLADDLAVVTDELEGRLALGRIDIDAQPSIAQALQVPSVPLVALVVQGRLQPMLNDAPPIEDLRAMFAQLAQQMAAQGMAGRHQPFAVAAGEEAGEEEGDPRYAAADDALMRGDLDAAATEYQRLLDANPADVEAALGLARTRLMQRTAGVDLAGARAAAAQSPDDVDAQIMVADLDLLGGHVDDAFDRLVGVVRRAGGAERDRARVHLIELFSVVGDADPRVLRGRRNLASALF